MYSVNNNLQPSLESLIEHVEFYKTIEGNELLKEFIEQIELVKKHEYNFVLKDFETLWKRNLFIKNKSKERVMDILSGFLILGALFGIFIAIQKLDSNVITQIDQNEKIIELLKELKNK